ncbi:MAG: OmpH family outer membrane protein, partial [Roseovarius sp.]|nr:OmpH family outer membrane protein [Roseovarius sp.]MBQ0811989.1 OmpH family outer membrane protein [Roseovarius sp.]
LSELLNEANAMVMIDARTVMLHTSAADVTELAVQRINAAIGAGPLAPEAAPEAAPEQPAPDQPAPTSD